MPLLPRNNRKLLRLSILSTSVASLGLATVLISRNPTSILSSTSAALLTGQPTPSPSTSSSPFSTSSTSAAISTSPTATTTMSTAKTWPTRPYTPRHKSFPYTTRDLTPSDPSVDTTFYTSPRFVTHIDDHAISVLRDYFGEILPRKGRIMDLCTSWISHYPDDIEEVVTATSTGKGTGPALEVLGIGMSNAEMRKNPVLLPGHYLLHDLNASPTIPNASSFPSLSPSSSPSSSSSSSFPSSSSSSSPHPPTSTTTLNLTSTTCTVSIDYLTSPHLVLSSLLTHTIPTGTIHLIISNRCFPTKAVARWLRISEEERLQMVGDYLWHSGWRDIEIVELSDGVVKREGEEGLAEGQGQGRAQGGIAALMRSFAGGMGFAGDSCDPLWVVRGRKPGKGEDENLGKVKEAVTESSQAKV